MNYTSITTKEDQVLNRETVFRILTARINNVIQHSLFFQDYISDCVLIKNNCRIAQGRDSSINFINIEDLNINKIDIIVATIIKLFNNINLYDKQLDSFTKKIIAKEVTFAVGKGKTIKQIELRSDLNIQYLYFVSELAPIIPKKEKLPELLKPGILNESFLELLVLDQLQKIKSIERELGIIFPNAFKNSKLILNLYQRNNQIKVKIGPILSITTVGNVRIGGVQQKPDILIKTLGENIKISIKANIFPEWSSASTYEGAKYIFDYFQSKGVIVYDSNKNLKVNNASCNGIAIPATLGEIKKFCFNGKEIDYIIINDFKTDDILTNTLSDDIDEISYLTKVHNNIYNLYVKCNTIYANTPQDIQRLQKTVYLTIQKSTSKSSKLLPGFRISFVPKNKLRGAHIIKTLTKIPGRL